MKRLTQLLCFLLALQAAAQPEENTPSGDGWRMIQGSASSDRCFALAWGQKGKSKAKMEPETASADFDDSELVNFVVDLKRRSILGQTKVKHAGDRRSYNHESCYAAWSVQNRFVVQTMSWKWHTEMSELHQIIDGKSLSPGTDLLQSAATAAFQKLKGQPPLNKFKKQDFAITIAEATFSENAGETRLTVKVWGQIPKHEDEDAYFEALVTFEVIAPSQSAKPVLKWIETKLIE